MASKKYSNGDKIACPYCGAKGAVSYSHDALIVVHRLEWRDVIAQGSGKTVKAEVLVDACSDMGKMGAVTREREEEDFV